MERTMDIALNFKEVAVKSWYVTCTSKSSTNGSKGADNEASYDVQIENSGISNF